MANFTQSELNSIREIVTAHQMTAAKLHSYANSCQDAHIKQMFTTAANGAQTAAQNLIQML